MGHRTEDVRNIALVDHAEAGKTLLAEALLIGAKAIRRALNSRDRGCRFPGCTHTRYVDGHHVKHWAHGGETKLANLVTLCRFHHRQVHEGQVVVQILDDGAFRFIRPDGKPFESPAPRSTDWLRLVAAHERQGIRVNPSTAITRWTGEALDYPRAIEWLSRKAKRQKNDSAESSPSD